MEEGDGGCHPTTRSTNTPTPRRSKRNDGVWKRTALGGGKPLPAQLLIELCKRHGREVEIAFDRQPQVPAGALKLPQAEGAELELKPIDQSVERIVAIKFGGVPRPGTVAGKELHPRQCCRLLLARPEGREGAAQRFGKQLHGMIELAFLVIAALLAASGRPLALFTRGAVFRIAQTVPVGGEYLRGYEVDDRHAFRFRNHGELRVQRTAEIVEIAHRDREEIG